MSGKGWRPPSFGIEVVEGRPGSGKSFYGVARVLRALVEERRPVYTNLPIRFRVLRAWLRRRHGAAVANLLTPLTREHFTAFLARQAKRNLFLERLQLSGLTPRERLAGFYAEHGPDVVRQVNPGDPKPNWIPPMSVILIDEAHQWYPQNAQRAEDPNLLSYVTMVRHHVHHLYVITQDRMQVSISFRRLAAYFWEVINLASERIAWSFTLGHLGLAGFRYRQYTPEQEDARSNAERMPCSSTVVLPWWPSESWKFRLYDSFTHLGDVRELRRQLREYRKLSGVGEDGQAVAEYAAPAGREGSMLRLIGRVVMVLVLVVVGVAVGRAVGGPKPAAVVAGPFSPPKVSGFAQGGVLIEGKLYRVNETGPGFVVRAVVPAGRVAVVASVPGDVLYVLRPGKPGLELGPSGEVLSRFRSAAEAGQLGSGPVAESGAGGRN